MQSDTSTDSFEQWRAWIWNGAEFEPATGLPTTDRGFRYGMSVFESFPVRDGVGIFLDAHLGKLAEACAATGLAAPPGALDACGALLEGAENGFGRIYVTAGDGPVTGSCELGRVVVQVERREPVPARVYHRGYDIGLHAGSHTPVYGGVKTGNYWSNLRAFREGVAAQFNETLLFTPAGHLISACMANVFVVTDGRVETPDPSTGARAGVVRDRVMQRIDVRETLMTRAGLAHADELFLTSSWLGIMPAASVDGRKLNGRTLSAQLMEGLC